MGVRFGRVMMVGMVGLAGALAGCDENNGATGYDPRVDGIVPHSEMTGGLAILEAPKARPAAASLPAAAPAAKPATTPKPEPEGGAG